MASIAEFGPLFGCLCTECYNSCSFSCSMDGTDKPDCVTCMQTAAGAMCSAQYAACGAN